MAGLQIRELHKRFPDGTEALEAVDLDVTDGELMVLVGSSGCGKTTLLRIIAGLEESTSGRVYVDGDDVTGLEPNQRDVAMVFQNYGLYPNKTVAGNVDFPLKMMKIPRAQRRERVAETLRLLGLEELARRLPGQLSGGQRQRVGIGRALVRKPSLLLMDEPLSNLDAGLRTRMRREIKALQRASGATTVYVTHDQAEALALADRLVVMNRGRVEQIGTPDEVFNAPATAFVASFLGSMNLLAVDDLPTARGIRALSDQVALDTGRRIHSIGVRSAQWRRGPAPEEEAPAMLVRGVVTATELIGLERLVSVAVDDVVVDIRMPASDRIPHSTELHVPFADLHLFDEGGDRIRR